MKKKKDGLELAQVQDDLTNLINDLGAIQRRLESIEKGDTLGVKVSGVIGGATCTLNAVMRDLFWVKESESIAMQERAIESYMKSLGLSRSYRAAKKRRLEELQNQKPSELNKGENA